MKPLASTQNQFNPFRLKHVSTWVASGFLAFALAGMICLPGCHASFLPAQVGSEVKTMLTVSDQEEPDRMYLVQDVRPGDQIQISWMHSVEKSTWMDTLVVTPDGRLSLEQTQFQSFGAGMPFTEEGKVSLKDGYVIISQLHRPMSSYRWVHSHFVGHTIRLNGQIILRPEEIPHHRMVELSIRQVQDDVLRQTHFARQEKLDHFDGKNNLSPSEETEEVVS